MGALVLPRASFDVQALEKLLEQQAWTRPDDFMEAIARTLTRGRGRLAVAWAVSGVVAALAFPVVRLGLRGVATISSGLSAVEWVGFVVCSAAFVYGEGERALRRRWAPWVVARAREVGHAGWIVKLLAPLYAMGFLGGPRRHVVMAWAGAFAIFVAVLIVMALPQPWRGIVDFSVAAALLWGTVAVVAETAKQSPG